MKHISFSLLLTFFFIPSLWSMAEAPKDYITTRTTNRPKIDGKLNDECWKTLPEATDFTENDPVQGRPSAQKTVVKLTYDNNAIYVAAMMYDTQPDSMWFQLGDRDDFIQRCENFRFLIDTYNTNQDGYEFKVHASGVQADYRFQDNTYNCVWNSAVQLLPNGWSVEMEIPYAAIRFSNASEQVWGFQFTRYIARTREFSQYNLTERGAPNPQVQWGRLRGINNIISPIRLSLTPYLAATADRLPLTQNSPTTYANKYNITGGADIKYGINESFTLDMTLLPDFGQVRSDDRVKNLSAFEVIFNENRPFFNEGIELFQRGNLFYSRRIGQYPSQARNAFNNLSPNEIVDINPDKSRLLNSFKVSGRTEKKLGIGIFNAITAPTYAIIKDTQTENTRKVLTEPLINYNILVADQQFGSNSSAYLINLNTNRGKEFTDANVTGAGLNLQDKKQQYQISGSFVNSYRHKPSNASASTEATTEKGSLWNANIRKINGHWRWSAFTEWVSPNYNINDMGFNFYLNYIYNEAALSYNQFTPFGKVFKEGNVNIGYTPIYQYDNKRKISEAININAFIMTLKFFAVFINHNEELISSIDNYEPRYLGRIFIKPKESYTNIFFSTNYAKRFALDWGGDYGVRNPYNGSYKEIFLSPIWKANDHFTITLRHMHSIADNDLGYISSLNIDSIYIGQRTINTIVNNINIKYLIKNGLSIALNNRHYWARGKYKAIHFLNLDGTLAKDDTQSNDQNLLDGYYFNSNFFNVDLVLTWQFAPGSNIILTYKNIIASDNNNQQIVNYMDDVRQTLRQPQINTLSLKLLYFLDWQYLKPHRKV
jgi:hypothetical protein